LTNDYEHPWVLMYINVWLTYMYFSLWKSISCFSFFDNSDIFFMINIYLDNHQAALKYLKDTEVSIHNILIMVGDFNIRDRKLNLSYLFYSSHSDSLDLKLSLSSLVYQVSTQYINNPNSSNLVINLIFLHPNLVKIDNYYILSEI